MCAQGKPDLPPPMDSSVYSGIGLDELVTYALYSLSRRGADTTFENAVAEAFSLFPQRFGLRRFPQWPDSAVVNKSWLRCRSDKQYIVGSVRDGFRLTPKGLEVAERLARVLEVGAQMPRRRGSEATETRTREGKLVRSLEESEAFRVWQATDTLDHMSDYDFCEMLMCTTESSPSVLLANLQQFRHACEVYERSDLGRFLESSERCFGHLLGKMSGGRYRGGMMRRRIPRGDS